MERAIAELSAAIEQELPKGALDGARVVAEEAATNHLYTNRTGRLQSRTQTGRVRGSALRGLIRAEVLGDTRYGGFVEHGTSRNRPYPTSPRVACADRMTSRGQSTPRLNAPQCARGVPREPHPRRR